MAHTCNSSCSEGGEWEDLWLEASLGKIISEAPISINKLGMVAHVCNLATWEAKDRKIAIWGQSGQKYKILLEKELKLKKEKRAVGVFQVVEKAA
jgi:hypothetical protein